MAKKSSWEKRDREFKRLLVACRELTGEK